MKKIFTAAFVTVILSSCHYGKGDAQKTIETNEKYKNEKSDYSTNRGNDGVMPDNKSSVDTTKNDATKTK